MTRTNSLAVALVAVAFAGACASNSKVSTSDEEYDDLAISLASTIRSSSGHGELVAMTDVLALAGGAALPGFSTEAGGHHGERTGVEYAYTLACRGADGLAATCATAATAEVDATWVGALDLAYHDVDLARDGRWTLAGLDGEVTTLAGDGHMIYQSTVASPDRAVSTYELEYAATYEGLALARGDLAPRAGTVHYAIEARRSRMTTNNTSARDLDATARLTFASEGRALLSLDDDARVYDLDLATGALTGR